ncbi:MAG: hypothetical protein ACFFCD_09065 [Promethearchaeota archaeon]
MIPPELYLDTVSIGCWFVVAGYHFLMFGFFLFQRFRIIDLLVRRTRVSIYWFYLALFFLLMAFGRGFFIISDFYLGNILWWRIGTCIQWFALAFLALLIGYLILDNLYHQLIVAIPPPVIALLILFIPESALAPFRLAVNYILAPLYAIFLPALFFYLAYHSVGTIRRGSILNGIGFLILYAGRVMASEVVQIALATTRWVSTILAPGLVILALLLISWGNQYELLT